MSQLSINFFGGPGSGKSVLAAYSYALLKAQGLNVELVREYAKDLVWSNNATMLRNQELVTTTQSLRQRSLYGKVDAIITDSPLMLGVAYDERASTFAKRKWVQSVSDEFHRYDNINIMLMRNKSFEFEQEGRVHNLEESLEMDKKILRIVKQYCKEGHVKLYVKELKRMWDEIKVLLISQIMEVKKNAAGTR